MSDPKLNIILTIDGKQYNATINSATSNTNQFGKQAKTTAADVNQLSGAIKLLVGGAVGLKLAQTFREVITLGMDFKQAIANVGSVSSATATELQQLERAARDQAKSSVFGASQAADAQYFLASAGLSVNEIITAQASVMSLAAATQSDLASTSEITTATLSQFGLTADESARVANVLAASISGSQATLPKLGDAMRYVGPVAKSLNMDLESTTAAISLLFNAGYRGEQAGTSLRASLVSLSKPSTEAAALIKDLELNVTDANGKFVGMESLITQLSAKQINLNQAATLFGTEAAPAMLAMIGQGTEKYIAMRDAITGTNKSMEMEKQQMDTLQGEWKTFLSTSEEASLSLYDELEPALRLVTQGMTAVVDISGMLGTMLGANLAARVATLSGEMLKKAAADHVAAKAASQTAAAEVVAAKAEVKRTTVTLARVKAEQVANAGMVNMSARVTAAEAAQTAATTRLAVAQTAYTVAVTRASLAARLAAASMASLRGLMAVMGGPLGIALTAAAGIAYWASTSDDASTSTKNFAERVAELKGNMTELNIMQLKNEMRETEQAIAAIQDKWSSGPPLFGDRDEYYADQQRLRDANRLLNELRNNISETQQQAASGGATGASTATGSLVDQKELQKLMDQLMPEEALAAKYFDAVEMLDAARQQGQISEQQYALSMASLHEQSTAEWTKQERAKTQATLEEQEKRRKAQEASLSNALQFSQQSLSATTAMLKQAGQEQSGVYRVLFAMQKAASIPAMIVSTNKAYTDALASGLTPPANQILAESVRASGYAAIGIAAGQAIAGLAGFKDGGSFMVGGSGGTDSQLVAFRASPDERVTIETPAQANARGNGGAGVTVNVIEDAAKAGQVSRSQMNSSEVIEIFVANIKDRGDAANALETYYQGMVRRGR